MSAEILITLGGVIVAFLGLIVAFVAFLRQTRDTHLSLGVQLLRELERNFDSQRNAEKPLRPCQALSETQTWQTLAGFLLQ